MKELCYKLPEVVSLEIQQKFLDLMETEGVQHHDWSPSPDGLIEYHSCDEHRITMYDKNDPNLYAKHRNDHDQFLFNRVNGKLNWKFAESEIAKLFKSEILPMVEQYFDKIYRVVLVSLKPDQVFRFHRDWFYLNDYVDIPERVKNNWDKNDEIFVDKTLHERQDYLAFKIPLKRSDDQLNRLVFRKNGKYLECNMPNNIFLFNEIEFHAAIPGGQQFGVIFVDGEMKMDVINSKKIADDSMLKEIFVDETEIEASILQNITS